MHLLETISGWVEIITLFGVIIAAIRTHMTGRQLEVVKNQVNGQMDKAVEAVRRLAYSEGYKDGHIAGRREPPDNARE